MKLNLKICGLRDPENIGQVINLSPEYIGFIFYFKSPRFVGEDFKMPDVPRRIKKVGVFVNESIEQIKHSIKEHSLDLIQLHGNETTETCKALKRENISLIKVFSVDNTFDFKTTKPYQSIADYFLFDTKGVSYGGNGKRFDWNILNQYNQKVPFFLSGGISLENIQEVSSLKNMNIHAVDVNSGVEANLGIKDIPTVANIKTILNSIS